MTIRKKTFIIIGLTLIGLVSVLYAFSNSFLLKSFKELEEKDTKQNTQRVLDVLESHLETLKSKTGDWANWDDTYAFIEDKNTEYIETNPTDKSFIELKINLMLFFNNNREIMFGKAFDLKNEKEASLPAKFKEKISPDDTLLKHENEESSITGVIDLNESLMLIASRPILTSNGEGPIKGTLIFGRFFDDAKVQEIAKETHSSFSIRSYDNPNLSSDFKEARSLFSENKFMFSRPMDKTYIAGYVLIKDIYGKPGIILKTVMPREVYEKGQTAIFYLIISILISGLVFGAVIILLLEKSIIRRFKKLSFRVSDIGKTQNISERVEARGSDEIAQLAKDINQMLEAVESAKYKEQETKERYQVLTNQLPEGIFLVDYQTKNFLETNYASRKMLGYSLQELSKLKISDIIPENHGEIDKELEDILGGKEKTREWQFRLKGGSFIDVEINSSIVSYKGKKILCMVFRDITKRKKTETQLKESHQILEKSISEKTRELLKVNKLLEKELEQRKIAEEKLRKRNEELEKALKFMEGRELKMIELKSKLKTQK